MSDVTEQDKKNLIETIRSDAEAEAARIVKQAGAEITEREKSVGIQIQHAKEEEGRRADEQIAAIEKRVAITESVNKRRADLMLRKQILERVVAQAKEAILGMKSSPRYSKALLAWMVEGIVGLETTRVSIEAPDSEIDLVKSLVPEAEEGVRAVTGTTIAVEGVVKRTDSETAGIVIRDLTGAQAFDNRLSARIQRYHNRIYRLISRRLFSS